MPKQLVFDECLMQNATNRTRKMGPDLYRNNWFLMNAPCKMQLSGLPTITLDYAQTAGF